MLTACALLAALAAGSGSRPDVSPEAAPPPAPERADTAERPAAPDLAAPPVAPGPALVTPPPVAPGATFGGAPVQAVAASAAGILVVDVVCGAWLASSLESSSPMFGRGGRSGDGAGAGLAGLCLVAVPPLAAVLGANAGGVTGSSGTAYWATLGTRLGATALTGWAAAKVAGRVSRDQKALLVPLLFIPSELILQPWVATRVLVATPRPPVGPSPADQARPVPDPAGAP